MRDRGGRRAWRGALLAAPAALLALACALLLGLVQGGRLAPPAGKLDLGALALVSGDELVICPDNRTVCGTFYRLDLQLPADDRVHTTQTLLRLPVRR